MTTMLRQRDNYIRAVRREGMRIIFKHSLVQFGMSSVSVILGILTIYLAMPDPYPPYIFGGPLIVGLPVFLITGALVLVSHNPKFSNDIRYCNKCVISLLFVTSIFGIVFGVLCGCLSGWALGYCLNNTTVYIEREMADVVVCSPNRNGNIVLAIADLIIVFVMEIWLIIGAYLVNKYSGAFGLDDEQLQSMTVGINYYYFTQVNRQNPCDP